MGAVRLASVAVVLSMTLLALSPPDRGRASRPVARTRHALRRSAPAAHLPRVLSAQVTIPPGAPSVRVPASFFGLSTEYWAVPMYERQLSLFERVLSLVQVHGGGPLILRIGGDSADVTFWNPRARVAPDWAFQLTSPWLRDTALVVRKLGLRLIIDLNLVTGSPLLAAQWARVAEQELPRGSIIGFEVGNEPDIYSRWYWRAVTARALFSGKVLPPLLSAASYQRDFRAYSYALRAVAPHVPLVGPALANPVPNLKWISRLLAGPRWGLGTVSGHQYPLSACAKRSAHGFPTVGRLLSEFTTARMAHRIARAVGVAHRAGLPFRLTELNSVTCHGRRGVSNTFATALWAPDALLELLKARVDGVNLHIRAGAINAPFVFTRNGLSARPLLYGLMLLARTLGPGARLLSLPLPVKPSLHLKVWGVQVSGGFLHVLLIDKGLHPVRVVLTLPAFGPGTVQRLLAPSAWARSGVTLDGQHLRTSGAWIGRPAGETVTPRGRRYLVTVSGESAALLSVRVTFRARHPHRLRYQHSRRRS